MNGNPEIRQDPTSADEQNGNAPAPKDDKFFRSLAFMLDYFELAMVAVLIALFMFTFCFRLCRVDGGSMKNTLQDTELLITRDLFYEPQRGDIVIFHLSNDYYEKPLVKRVIATEGQEILIDLTTKEVYVDGVLLDEPYVYLDSGYYNPNGYFDHNRLYEAPNGHTVFSDVVPEGMVFVMGDNRNHSSDSRSVGVGFIDENCILGKAVLRLSPFTVFH